MAIKSGESCQEPRDVLVVNYNMELRIAWRDRAPAAVERSLKK
jgi:hypothetical protein